MVQSLRYLKPQNCNGEVPIVLPVAMLANLKKSIDDCCQSAASAPQRNLESSMLAFSTRTCEQRKQGRENTGEEFVKSGLKHGAVWTAGRPSETSETREEVAVKRETECS